MKKFNKLVFGILLELDLYYSQLPRVVTEHWSFPNHPFMMLNVDGSWLADDVMGGRRGSFVVHKVNGCVGSLVSMALEILYRLDFWL